MIILLVIICMQLYAVDVELATPIMQVSPYEQALQEREIALQELHPEPRTWYDPYCISGCNRDAARRLFPHEQDAVNTPCQSCYIALRRSGCALDHCVCCTHTAGCTIECTTAVIAATSSSWCAASSALLAAIGISIATPFTVKFSRKKTKECDRDLSIWRIQHHTFVPAVNEIEPTESDTNLI